VAPDVATLVGADEIPHIEVKVGLGIGAAGLTADTRITLDYGWIVANPDDTGGVVHELTHAIMRVPQYPNDVRWLTEGIADYVRDALGFEARHSFAHFETGGATRGYQTTAHFLGYLEERHPGTIRSISRSLSQGSYRVERFRDLTGSALQQLVERYETEHAPGPQPPP
jgi:hypothetical protein